ncbi:MAG: hypothetical protein KDH09_16730 [Chrysiogenetes bacterium]|nr:hypothetical protein [Chrysiogenetes bacterium]
MRLWAGAIFLALAILVGLPGWCLAGAGGYLLFLATQELIRRRFPGAESVCGWLRAAVDLIGISILVAATGALTTIFVILYPVLVTGAASIWGKREGRLAQLSASLSYGFVLLGTYYEWWPYLWFEPAQTQVHAIFASHPVWGDLPNWAPFWAGFAVMLIVNYVAYFFPNRLLALRTQEAEARIRLDRKLQEAQRQESLAVLAGGVAHDFNNLLMAMMGNARLAQELIEADSPAREHLTQMQNAAKRAGEITRQLLAYAGKAQAIVEPLNLSEIVQETTHLLRVSIPHDVACEYTLAEALPPVRGDGAQVRQLVMNLVVNAAEAMNGDPGRIRIYTGLVRADRGYLRDFDVGGERGEGHYVFLQVEDSGCGMSPDVRRRIFDPFFTTKGGGHGLGLAAVLGIVRAHQGALRIETLPAEGTSFIVLFPALETPAPAALPETAEMAG